MPGTYVQVHPGFRWLGKFRSGLLPVIEGAQLLFDAFGIARIVWQVLVFLIVLGFPNALVLAWAYELPPEEAKAGSGSESGPGSVRPRETSGRSGDVSAETPFRAGDLEFGTPEPRRPSIAVLPFEVGEREVVLQLPKLPDLHRDPFDRMLLCQAIEHGLTIVTPDRDLRQHPDRTEW